MNGEFIGIGAGELISSDKTYPLDSNYISTEFWDFNFDGDTVIAKTSSNTFWTSSESIGELHFQAINYEETVEMRHIDVNTWTYVLSNGNSIKIHLLSAQGVEVEEEGELVCDGNYTLKGQKFRYRASYILRKVRSYDYIPRSVVKGA